MSKFRIFGFLIGSFVALTGMASPASAMEGQDSETLAQSSTKAIANIQAGNWNVDGSFRFTKNSNRNNDRSETEMITGFGYFVLDRLNLGLALGVSAYSDEDTVASLGPSSSYYFWSSGKLTSFVGLGFRIGLTDATVSSMVLSEIGARYFVTPSVAFGPSLYLNHYNRRSGRPSYEKYGMTASFAIYI